MDQTTNTMQAPAEAPGQVNEVQPVRPEAKEPFVNVGETERFGSILGGAALVLAGLSRRGASGALLGVLGAMLVGRGISGHCGLYQKMRISGVKTDRPGVPDNIGISLERSVVIHRSPEDVYRFWRDFGNLGGVMRHVEKVVSDDGLHSHWIVRTPWGRRVEWDAVVINEHPGEMIAWESLPGADVQNAGAVRFEPEPHGNGTLLVVKLEYNPPWGLLGRLAVALLGEEPGREIQEDLWQLKRKLEGELQPMAS